MSYRILIVDDEEDILEFVGYNLSKQGYEVHTANNGRSAVEKSLEVLPHLVLLDVMMPEMNGIETCRQMRGFLELANTIIAFLSARSEEESQLSGFDAGADDYITKPIRMNILLSRVKAMLKRVDEAAVSQGGRSVMIDSQRHLVIKDGREMLLPRKEFNLLALLWSKPQKVFTREEIYTSVWGNDVVVGDRTIDVHIRKLREKIGDNHIVTIKGIGYKYED